MPTNEEFESILSTEESWSLLEGSQFGRLAVSVANNPDIFPLNFLAHDGLLLIRTNPGTKLAELAVNATVAFETDCVTANEAWSVVVKGTARILESQTEIDAANELPLQPWTQSRKWTYVEITPTSINGRRFALGAEPERY
ncbi:pyridoxamine 5'-phosphate oxidase [Arthrobacter sp. ERGS1:01]|uniref:pyridoxamine 5'-phosphate oxidase family protein n=1 Tax=Arthrobacter sp. ERGS1:01 TaxID=1704044 RepID=UPI0006B5B42A|nr:pyridoxamine 5'-phosphate oxidase family protein [Arthrobacter sp. ERGS1:01]ALE05639.1 pyridoxamine 5'-phosphate oxidase [Arthrobacter sp. ERGS1:01]